MTDILPSRTTTTPTPPKESGSGDLVEAAGHPVGSGLIKPGYDPRLTNEDLAPLRKQTWSSYNIFAFWMSDVHSVGGYVTAGSLFALGLASWQVLVALLVGITIVYFFCNLVAKPSQVTGVPYPVICRSVFGVLGANIPAIIRGLIAVAWYGIQTFLASAALDVVLIKLFPSLAPYAVVEDYGFAGLSALGWGSFMLLWVLQACVFWRGMESIRRFIDFCGPDVYVVMFMLCGYLIYKAGWSAIDLTLGDVKYSGFDAVPVMLGAIALVVSYFSGPMLNFGDFSRYGKSFAAVKKGNFLGLPLNFLVFSVLVVVTRRTHLHHRHDRHQHRGQLHFPGLRLLQRESAEDQLARRRNDRSDRLDPHHAVELVQQSGRHSLHTRNPRSLHRSAVRNSDCRLLPRAQAEGHRRRTVQHVADRNLLVQQGIQPCCSDRHRGGSRRRDGPGPGQGPHRDVHRSAVQLVHRLWARIHRLLPTRRALFLSCPECFLSRHCDGRLIVMRIKVINPNTTWAMTAKIEECARTVAGSGTFVEAVSPAMGPASIESHYDEALSVPGILTEIAAGEKNEVDGYVIACFGDPGLDAARELAKGPVVAVAEAAMNYASFPGRGFSIVTTLGRTRGRAADLVDRYGMQARCRGIHSCEIPVLELDRDPDARKVILEACFDALEQDDSDVLVLGCAGMADLCQDLSDELGVPVVDGVAAGVTMVQSLVTLGLSTSSRGEFARPLPKNYTGTLTPFSL